MSTIFFLTNSLAVDHHRDKLWQGNYYSIKYKSIIITIIYEIMNMLMTELLLSTVCEDVFGGVCHPTT